jgi:hypothetical protein
MQRTDCRVDLALFFQPANVGSPENASSPVAGVGLRRVAYALKYLHEPVLQVRIALPELSYKRCESARRRRCVGDRNRAPRRNRAIGRGRNHPAR